MAVGLLRLLVARDLSCGLRPRKGMVAVEVAVAVAVAVAGDEGSRIFDSAELRTGSARATRCMR